MSSELSILNKVPRIAITGTKGKTTVTNILSQVFQKLSWNVLHVDTTGHFVNGVRKSTLDDSKRIWGLVPSVASGRYLYEFFIDPKLTENGIAILESALGCSSGSGIAYREHNIGVFLNVFEDHIGSSERIKSKEDIVHAKSFIFSRLGLDGVAVYNADDLYVVSALPKISEHIRAIQIPFGITCSHIDLVEHAKNGGTWVTIEDQHIIVQSQKSKKTIVSLGDVLWTFDGMFKPSVYNLLAIVATCVAHFGIDNIPEELGRILSETRFDQYGGRLTILQDNTGVTILADYAHEKFSLVEVGTLAKTLTKHNGKVIGVVRMAYDRTDELIADTGRYIADSYDTFIVYDKIDGYWRQPNKRLQSKLFTQKIGHVSAVLGAAIREKNTHCDIILREDEAIARAYELANPGDVIVFIVNDDIERSINFVKDICHADFV
jgi:cyanophycin synthetase